MTAADVEGPRAGTSNGATVLAEYFVTDTSTLLYIVRSDLEAPVVEAFDLGSRELRPWVMDNFGPAPADTSSGFDEEEFREVVGPLVEPVLEWTEPDDVVWFVPHDV